MKHRPELVLIAAYNLCHPTWSSGLIQQQIKSDHKIKVLFFTCVRPYFFLLKHEVSLDQVKDHRKKSEYLRLIVPEKRGRKRKLEDDASKKAVKRELKKKRSTPKKAAKRLSDSPNFKGSISRSSIYRKMSAKKRKRESNKFLQDVDEIIF